MTNYAFKYSPHNVILVSNKESFRTPLALINNLVLYKGQSYLLSLKKNSEIVKTLKSKE